MFTDPLPGVSINSVSQVLPRVTLINETASKPSDLTGRVGSVYQKADGLITVTVSHQTQKNGRVRTSVVLEQKAVVTNPLDSSNDYDTLSCTFVLDRPSFGFTITQVEQLTAALTGWLITANVDKLYGKES